jgi:hypothetical protein
MGAIYRVIYCSKSNLSPEEGGYDAGIKGILATARRNNAHDGLTGALLFSRGGFAQVLEGPLGALRFKLAQIEQDDRHSHLKVLEVGPVPGREFSAWSMAYAGTSSKDDPLVGAMLERAGADPAAAAGQLFDFLKLSIWQGAGAV